MPKSFVGLLCLALLVSWVSVACDSQAPGTEPPSQTDAGLVDGSQQEASPPEQRQVQPDVVTTPDPSAPDVPVTPREPSVSPEPSTQPDAGAPDQAAPPEESPEPSKTTVEIGKGDASGKWCGRYHIKGSVTIPQGKTLTVCAGSELLFERAGGITVIGTLLLEGTKGQVILLKPTGTLWLGLQITGTFQGAYFTMEKGKTCLTGLKDSKITVDNGKLLGCTKAFRLISGGTFTKSEIRGGNTTILDGGMLRMTDSVLDLQEPRTGPDCTKINAGGMVLDHVRFTGCHCPIHINASTMTVKVTNSIFDDASYPMMIAKSNATFTGNHFVKGAAHILDIGGSINANVANNYWDGGKPKIQTSNASQFKGTATYSTKPFPGVGPR